MSRSGPTVGLVAACVVGLLVSCGADAPTATSPPSSPSSSADETSETTFTSPTATPTTISLPTPTTVAAVAPPDTTATDTTAPSTSTPDTVVDPAASLVASYPDLEAAVYTLALGNVAVSASVHHDGAAPWGMAAGRRADGAEVTSDTPFVIASVSKLITALSIARLVERGVLTPDTTVDWNLLGLRADPQWADVTVRELLDHTSGMPINRASWLDDPGPCSIPLQEALLDPPTIARSTWQYSNGNYCALGLLVEALTGESLDAAADELVFTPAGVSGPYLSTEGLRPDSAPSPRGVARLARLGGAGTWLASTDDLVAVLDDVTDTDLAVLRWPGIILDQYGWGHTGTVDGAKACAWVMDGGRTTVAAVVSGPTPASGGDVCDAIIPALASDLGIWAGEPLRTPL
jgi:D-alanyl-D-alanine carboxypeptidase